MAGAILVLSIASLAMPYRLVTFNEFPQVTWRNERCYALGERTDATLLFCPSRNAPRTIVVRTGTDPIEPTGIVESIFASF